MAELCGESHLTFTLYAVKDAADIVRPEAAKPAAKLTDSLLQPRRQVHVAPDGKAFFWAANRWVLTLKPVACASCGCARRLTTGWLASKPCCKAAASVAATFCLAFRQLWLRSTPPLASHRHACRRGTGEETFMHEGTMWRLAHSIFAGKGSECISMLLSVRGPACEGWQDMLR